MCVVFASCDITGRLNFIFPVGFIFSLFGRYASISVHFSIFSRLSLIFGTIWIFTPKSAIDFLVSSCGITMMSTLADFCC